MDEKKDAFHSALAIAANALGLTYWARRQGMKEILILAVDFDGTIANNRFPKVGAFKPYALWTLKRHQKRGGKVLLFTCRDNIRTWDAILAMEKRGFTPDYVNEQTVDFLDAESKPYYDLLIDDRALLCPVTDWHAVDIFLKEFAPKPDNRTYKHLLASCFEKR